MCANIGVDPLASGKGFWSNMLDIGDFYYELGKIHRFIHHTLYSFINKDNIQGVQIVEVCMANQHKTGGLMELGEIRHKLIRSRGRSKSHQEITLDDLLRATKKLKVLGTGFTVIPLKSGRYLVQSVPGEMSMDQVNTQHSIFAFANNTIFYLQLSVLEQAEKTREIGRAHV